MYSASAPGSIMLFGEHSVLHGEKAIIMPIDKFIYVSITPRADNKIIFISDKFETLATSLESLDINNPYKFTIAVILQFKPSLTTGFQLEVKSEFSETIGFGSSAAITVATVKVISKLLQLSLGITEIISCAYKAVLHVQSNLGSGADVAASAVGRLIAYDKKDQSFEVLRQQRLDVYAYYVGYKTPTTTVLEKTRRQHNDFTNILYKAMGEITLAAKNELNSPNMSITKLGTLMNYYHGLLNALGVSDLNIEQLCFMLRSISDIAGVKISGSGLGDCVIAIGEDFKLNSIDKPGFKLKVASVKA